MNAGKASVQSDQLIALTLSTISPPVKISAGAEIAGMDDIERASGSKKINSKNNPAVTTDAKPVRPPTDTPVPDSTNAYVGPVPAKAPTKLPIESASNALFKCGNFPSLIKPACRPTPNVAAVVSNNVTSNNTKITLDKDGTFAKLNWKIVLSRPCGVEKISVGNCQCPKINAATAVKIIPKKTAPLIRKTIRLIIAIKPIVVR